jgi:predicted RNase H-like HicB family nuclease
MPLAESANRYHIDIFWSDEDDCFVANLPDLQYCSAFGDTPQEALAELLIAKELWLESCVASGFPLPEARYRSVSHPGYVSS